MTLVERLREETGRVGEYRWTVEVWRSDTLAHANLRVKTTVERVHELPLWFPPSFERVYDDVDISSEGRVEDTFPNAIDDAKSVAERFDRELDTVESISA